MTLGVTSTSTVGAAAWPIAGAGTGAGAGAGAGAGVSSWLLRGASSALASAADWLELSGSAAGVEGAPRPAQAPPQPLALQPPLSGGAATATAPAAAVAPAASLWPRLLLAAVLVLGAVEMELGIGDSGTGAYAAGAFAASVIGITSRARGGAGAGGASDGRTSGSGTSICALPRGFSDGEWRLPPEATAAAAASGGGDTAAAAATSITPPCCAWDMGTVNAQTCAEGEPRAPGALGDRGVLRGPDYFFARAGGRSCSCPANAAGDALRWAPRGCVLPAFDARRFCRLLRGRRLLFVGDSTSDQTAAALINTVRAGFGAPEPRTPRKSDGGGSSGPAAPAPVGCGSSIMFATSDTLVGEKFGGCAAREHAIERECE